MGAGLGERHVGGDDEIGAGALFGIGELAGEDELELFRSHSGAGEDPLAALRKRDPMVPLTDAVILFRVGPNIVEEPGGTIVVNRDLVEWARQGELDARSLDLPAS